MLDRIVAGHDHVHPCLSYYDDEARTAMAALRCNTVAGRLAPAGADTVHPGAWGFLAEPGAAGLLRPLPESCRDCALSDCLMRVINAVTPPEPIVEACSELASDLSMFAAEVAFTRSRDRAAGPYRRHRAPGGAVLQNASSRNQGNGMSGGPGAEIPMPRTALDRRRTTGESEEDQIAGQKGELIRPMEKR